MVSNGIEQARADLREAEYGLQLLDSGIAAKERDLQNEREKREVYAQNVELRRQLLRQLESTAANGAKVHAEQPKLEPRAESLQGEILEVLKAAGGKRLSIEEIEKQVRLRGHSSNAKNPGNAVRNALNNLRKAKKPVKKAGRGFWRYQTIPGSIVSANGRSPARKPPGRYSQGYKPAADALRDILFNVGSAGATSQQLIAELKSQGYFAGSKNAEKSLGTLVYQARNKGLVIDFRSDGTYALMTEITN